MSITGIVLAFLATLAGAIVGVALGIVAFKYIFAPLIDWAFFRDK